MPRVLFISEGLSSAPTRYRAAAYFDRLRRAGWEPEHFAAERGVGKRLAMLRAAGWADVVVVLRKTFTFPLRLRLRMRSPRLVLDLDDAVFLRDDGSASGTRARRFAAMARRCDAIWAGNDYLAEHARPYCAKVTVLPTSVDPGAYPEFTTEVTESTEKKDTQEQEGDKTCFASAPTANSAVNSARSAKLPDTLDLVWIGSSSTRKYLEGVLPTLEQAAERLPQLRLKIVADFDLPTTRLRTLPVRWSEAAEAGELASAHIGIAPMPEDPWTRGKCGLKVLQYMAAGLPVIASDAGVHPQMVLPGQTGYLAQSPQQWIEALTALAADPGLRRRLGDAGQQHVIANYSLDATFTKMLAALKELATDGHR